MTDPVLSPARRQVIRARLQLIDPKLTWYAEDVRDLLAAVEALEQEKHALRETLKGCVQAHVHCADSWYCCGKCEHPDHGELDSHQGEAAREAGVCNCGADDLNQRIAVLLRETEPTP